MEKILNTGIVAGFLYLFYVYAEMIGDYPADMVQGVAKTCMPRRLKNSLESIPIVTVTGKTEKNG